MRRIMDAVRAAHAARVRPEVGKPTSAQRAAMPHVVECRGLTVHDPGAAFAEAFQGRRLWCRENCRGLFAVEPIRDAERDTGRRFRFADEADAAGFRRRWG
jgi:hypothetical protein